MIHFSLGQSISQFVATISIPLTLLAVMRPIYEESEDDWSDGAARSHLPPMRPCSSATQSTRKVSFTNRKQTQAKSRTHVAKDSSYLDACDDSSVETMTSAGLYSLHNHKPKKAPSFTDYIFCQASFHDLVEEVKGTWEDAASAVDQIVHAFVISDEDLELVVEQIELAEKEIDVHIVRAVRDIGVKRC